MQKTNSALNPITTVYAYDANGNPTSATGETNATYTWGAGNRLLSISTGSTSTTTSFQYDGDGKLILKDRGPLAITHYRYDRNRVEAMIDGSGTILARYAYTPDGTPLSITIPGTETFYYHYDPLGNVERLTTSTGTLAVRYRYDAYGRIIQTMTGPGFTTTLSRNIYRFMAATGMRFDTDINLYLANNKRFYDPLIGRYLSADSHGGYVPCWGPTCPKIAVDVDTYMLDVGRARGTCGGSNRMSINASFRFAQISPNGNEAPRSYVYDACAAISNIGFSWPGSPRPYVNSGTGRCTCDGKERGVCVRNAYDCFRARDTEDDAYQWADQRYSSGGHNDPKDAFRHCMWSALMTKRANADFAEQMGDAHEEAGRCRGQDPGEEAMDQKNNRLGRQVGIEGEEKEDVWMADRCQQLEREGKLQTSI